MTAADALLGVLFAAVTAYALFGGADFGAGFWDLFAGGARTGARTRKLIEHAIGPVWEANHVWLIFAVVLLWTGFPAVFAGVAATMYIPLTGAALGIIGRGAGFAFRKTSTTLTQQRIFGALFAFSSLVTPFFLGAVAGGIASARVPPWTAGRGDLLTAWWNPTSVATGVLAVTVCAYLAAVFLCQDAKNHEPDLVPPMRRRALWAGAGAGVLAAVGLVAVELDAGWLAERLWRPVPGALIVVSVLAGLASIALLAAGRYVAVRVTAGLAVAAVLWGWAAAQYPYLLPPSTTVAGTAAAPAVMRATLWAVLAGAVILTPSLWWLFRLFQTAPMSETRSLSDSSTSPVGGDRS
ncbi:cytochrome d ubiquinol oxidase subunit II [Dactylosporangium vinaceum]|uniref:Cytochrome d ubiquinol oxidase subunit II n=1 Tax=Dactylosporangium vinaceum TaxID=53362 RepID=A0ABV5MB86_9ACTN|nr:cytochrome d ubiquinol oxidase subunit II [Dactylosporangium vinaceum]UAB98361.1 cytochrome d ubiquinol oxidase subunit II [Dactylosporangium vinaceum]